jgi:hypothetical protein
MADIFISYSSHDASHVRMLVSALEASGYSVWWDNELRSGDDFRQEIAAELDGAGAVIDYYDIPLPFGNYHTPHVSKTSNLIESIRERIESPTLDGYPVRQGILVLKHEALYFLGVMGGALSVFVNFEGLIKVARFSQWIVNHWREITRAAWVWAFSWLHIKVPEALVGPLTFLVFMASLTFAGLFDRRRFALRTRGHVQYFFRGGIEVNSTILQYWGLVLMFCFLLIVPTWPSFSWFQARDPSLPRGMARIGNTNVHAPSVMDLDAFLSREALAIFMLTGVAAIVAGSLIDIEVLARRLRFMALALLMLLATNWFITLYEERVASSPQGL